MSKHVLLAARAWAHQVAIDRVPVANPVRLVSDDDIGLSSPLAPSAIAEFRIEKPRTCNEYLDLANSLAIPQLFGELRIAFSAASLPRIVPGPQGVNDGLGLTVRELGHVRCEIVVS